MLTIKENRNKLSKKINYINTLKIPLNLKVQLINNEIKVINILEGFITNKLVDKVNKETIVNKETKVNKPNIPKKYALLVGINYINTSNQLEGCINDALNLKNMLITRFSFNDSDCILLTDNTKVKPTKTNILNNLTNILKNSVSGDTVVFTYSGHGTNTVDLSRDEDDGQDELLVPIDATSIRTCILDDDLKQLLVTYLKPDVKMFCIVDSCFSGTIFDLKYNYFPVKPINNITDKFSVSVNKTEKEAIKSNLIVISGCQDNQTSADAQISKNNYQGAMTFTLLETIKNKGTNISLQDLLLNMINLLKSNGFSQVAQLSSGNLSDITNVKLNTCF
jgi:hypothetical protein